MLADAGGFCMKNLSGILNRAKMMGFEDVVVFPGGIAASPP
jgi:hypothetical protein